MQNSCPQFLKKELIYRHYFRIRYTLIPSLFFYALVDDSYSGLKNIFLKGLFYGLKMILGFKKDLNFQNFQNFKKNLND